jgi:hypothetical protein
MTHKPIDIPQTVHAPTARALAIATLIALVVAGIVLITVVLPAEYAIDPLGTGKALGLSALSGATRVEPVPPPEGDRFVPVVDGPFALYRGEYRFDSREFVLGPYEYVEYKYHLEQGATMLFSWRASGDVEHDFHGDPDANPKEPQSFDKQPRRQADGSFAAPFAGIHGWYWENAGGDTVRVKLTTAGFYTSAHQFRYNGTRQSRAVRALDTIVPATDTKEIP